MNCAEMKFKTMYRSWTFALFIYHTTEKIINFVLRDRAGRRKSHVTWLSNWGTRLVFIRPHGEKFGRKTDTGYTQEEERKTEREEKNIL